LLGAVGVVLLVAGASQVVGVILTAIGGLGLTTTVGGAAGASGGGDG
jgi:hypothetical protein